MAKKATTSAAKGATRAPVTPSSKTVLGKKAALVGKAAPVKAPTAAKATTSKPAVKLPVKASPPPTVTLRHLAAALAERHDMPKKQADMILTDVFGGLVKHLKAGERIRIGGLGIIEVKNRAARMGRNPATGESIQIKASKKITFRPAKELKDAI
jgi:DNA-binding protein HU-beta